MATIILADDHEIVRHGFRALIQAAMGFTVVGEAADGREAVELVRQKRPDVLVVDLTLPGLDGLEVIRRVRAEAPATRVVVLTMHSHDSYVVDALRRGALAYVLKESGVEDLVEALRAVLEGRTFLSAGLPQDVLEQSRERTEGPADPYELLTDREREVLQLVAEGYTSPEIGDALSISPRTADTYRAKIMAKLDLKGLPDLVRYALQRGLISLERRHRGEERK